MQSKFMASQMVKDMPLNEPVNGLVSDAAHSFWADRNALLIITSVCSLILRCWILALMTYSNGASAEHYKLHFLALFWSLTNQAKS